MQPHAHAGSSLTDFSTMKMEAIFSSETSVQTISTRPHIPEDHILHSHSCENLESYTENNLFMTFVSVGEAILIYCSYKYMLSYGNDVMSQQCKTMRS
jgi:hypothetical protein